MKQLGLKRVLILSVMLLVGLSVSISSMFFYVKEKETLTEIINSESESYVELKASIIEALISEKVAGVKKLAKQFKNQEIKGSDEELIEKVHFLANAMNLGSATLAFQDGRAYWNQTHEDWPGGKYTKDVTLRPWYQTGRNASGVTVTEPYGTDVLFITIVEKVKEGTISADMELGFLNELVAQSNDIPGATVAILNHDTTVLASNSSVIKTGQKGSELSWFKDIAADIVSQKSFVADYSLNGVDKALYSHRIRVGDKEWYLTLSLDKSVVFSKLKESRDTAILVATLASLISVVIAFILIQILYKPIVFLKQTVLDLSSGDADLTQRLEVNSTDDLGQIAQGVNQFVENLQNMMLQIQSVTMTLQANVDKMREKSKQNTETLKTHVTETEQIVTAIEEMNATADCMASDAANTAGLTQKANDISVRSKKTVEQSMQTVSSLIADVDNASENVQRMNDETQSINTILSVIGEIAEQTNLLALNAAIEAARAGEQGRGFAVVADEVRNLASRTKDSTQEVEVALDKLLKGTKTVVDSMNSTKSRCQETAGGASDVAASLESMSSFVDEINDLSTQIATAAEEQSSVTQELSRNISTISEIVVELEQSGQESLAEAEQVAEINHQLVSIVSRFKL
ncbi:methyl-accepting chemotaxis protein [Vibrio sp. CAU 1672]|uniref:methyl-accepting chemotaxis protein n=1 Tax=Vibrio sp. CAU 1672 TaxID=3032594 RepID=UPI0023D9BF32|nr:methyl-accepting chemotaxis protein [Vibrio sp. CAU 1672]MDF2152805.1 methyl-accepting chemotaxis protein [Vibrio sp. CAU 1672]